MAAPLTIPLEVTLAVKLPAVGLVEKVTVSALAVAEVTVPTAPLLKVTRLFPAVVSKLVPFSVMVLALAARVDALLVRVGALADTTILATCTAAPLLREFVVTTAVKFPTTVGLVVRVIVRDVVVAKVTLPIAPPLKATVFRKAIGSKPKPLIVTRLPFNASLVVLLVTTGVTVATWIAVPLVTPFVVITAVRLPAIGFVEKETVSEVRVAAVTVPTAPLLKTTVLSPAVVSKPEPVMVSVATFAAKFVVLAVTIGVRVATCNAVPLLLLLVVITAVKLPANGFVENVTVSAVAVAEVTVPTAPLLNTTVLLPADVLKPKPLIVIVVAVRARLVVLLVTTGITVAICTAEPLLTLLLVTTAVKLPAVAGLVENVTVRTVRVAVVTVPTAPLLNTTVLFPAVVSKPKPLMVTVAALAARFAVLLVTTGVTVATCTAEPFVKLLVVTTAVRFPAPVLWRR